MSNILDLPEWRELVRRWTVAEYEELGDDPAFRHTELIRGIIVNKMSKTTLHSRVAKRAYDYFFLHARRDLVVWKEDPLRLADSMPEPDVAVVQGPENAYGEQHPATAELVVEVAVTSLAQDREKASIYAEAGVSEYWIVRAEAQLVEVYRLPMDGVYREKRTYGRGERIEGVGVTAEAVAVDALFV